MCLFCLVQFKQLEVQVFRLQDDVEVVITKDCAGCPSEECIEYIHALTIYGMHVHV